MVSITVVCRVEVRLLYVDEIEGAWGMTERNQTRSRRNSVLQSPSRVPTNRTSTYNQSARWFHIQLHPRLHSTMYDKRRELSCLISHGHAKDERVKKYVHEVQRKVRCISAELTCLFSYHLDLLAFRPPTSTRLLSTRSLLVLCGALSARPFVQICVPRVEHVPDEIFVSFCKR